MVNFNFFYKPMTFSHMSTNETNIQDMLEKKIRLIRDNVGTSAFTDAFLGDVNMRKNFFDYSYNFINTKIQTELNDNMTNDNVQQLVGSEDVFLVFKGGNVMGIYFDKYFANIDNVDDYKKFFKVSDVDYTLYIKTNDNSRFIQIKYFVKNILINALKEISETFDIILNKNKLNYVVSENEYEDKDNTYDDFSYINYVNIKKLFSTFDDVVNNEISNETKMTLLLANSKTHTLFSLCNIIKSMQIINGHIDIHNFSTIIKNLKQKCSNILNTKLNILAKDFYNDKRVDTLKNSLVEKLNEEKLLNITYFERLINVNKNIVDTFVFDKNKDAVNLNDVQIVARDHVVVLANDDANEQTKIYNIDNKSTHYISHNNAINVHGVKIFTSFDLSRIKFNIVLNNHILKNNIPINLKIPSEFLDISIPNFRDLSRELFFDHLKIDYKNPEMIELKYENNNEKLSTRIYAYSIEDVLSDLIHVLFYQKAMTPWLDGKYDKRLSRMIFFYLLNKKTQKRESIVKLSIMCEDISVFPIPLSENKSFEILLPHFVIFYYPSDNNVDINHGECIDKLMDIQAKFEKKIHNHELFDIDGEFHSDYECLLPAIFTLIFYSVQICLFNKGGNENKNIALHNINYLYKLYNIAQVDENYVTEKDGIIESFSKFIQQFGNIKKIIKNIEKSKTTIQLGGKKNSSYYAKYTKYKQKYIDLKNLID